MTLSSSYLLPYSKCSIYPPPAWIRASTWCLIAMWRQFQISGMLCIVWKPATIRFRRVSTSSTGDKYTKDFKWPHKKKFSVFKSGERGGQANGPPLPIYWPGNFRYSTSSRPALGSTQSPIHWVMGTLSPGVKRPGRETDHSRPTSAQVKKTWIYTSTNPYFFMGKCLII
jgi:hypothetical protein